MLYRKNILLILSSLFVFSCSGSADDNGRKKDTKLTIEYEIMKKNGNRLIKEEKFKDAIIVFDKMIEMDPYNSPAYNGKAIAFDHAGNHLAAQDLYKMALSLDPQSLSIKNNLAMSLILDNRPSQAIELLEPIIQQHQTDGLINNKDLKIARHNLALAYGISGSYDKAANINKLDMSAEKVEENTKFYKKYHKNLKNNKTKNNNIGFTIAEDTKSPEPKAANIKTPKKEKISEEVSKVIDKELKESEDTFLGKPAVYEYPN
ncbi:MAG: tetratricopeptide repeat protein [Rickettsiales bacterium]